MTNHHRHNLFFAFIFFLLLGSLTVYGSIVSTEDNRKKINTVNLLMPLIFENLDTRTVQYILKGYNGCYEWFSSQPKVLKVQGFDDEEDECYSYASATLATNQVFNNIIWITAKDKETSDVLKCEARVAKIQKVEILTKLRTINTGDIEVLEVLGYDKDGNVFSTLEGVRFEWGVDSERKALDFLSIQDSAIKTTELRKRLESRDFKTDITVVKGLKPGKAKVTVTVREEGYSGVTHSVMFYVIEKFIIYPDYKVYVLPYTKVNFRLARIRSDNHIEVVNLPEDRYRWTNMNSDRANIYPNGLLSCLDRLGPVDIRVEDIYTEGNVVENTVTIVFPFTIKLQIKECSVESECWEQDQLHKVFERSNGHSEGQFDNIWNLIKEQKYYVRAFLYDQAGNEIYITKDVQIKFGFGINGKPVGDYIEVIAQKNHQLIFKPIKLERDAKITAFLDQVTISTTEVWKNKTPIETVQPFSISSKVFIVRPHESIHLPLLGEGRTAKQQTLKMYALGGSGTYEWTSKDRTIAAVDKDSVILPNKVGITVIEVKDVLNKRNMDTIRVEVSQMNKIMFLERFRETLTDHTGYINIYAIGGEEQRTYSSCSLLSVYLDMSNPTRATEISEPLSYGDYQSYLNGLYKDNVHYKRLLDDHNLNYNVNHYQSYIRDDPASEQKIVSILEGYKNYGMCTRCSFRGNVEGETTVKVLQNNPWKETKFDEITLKVYDPFTTAEPAVVKGVDREREVILSLESSFQWTLKGGPTKWDTTDLNTNIQTALIRYTPLPSKYKTTSFEIRCEDKRRSLPYEDTLKLSSQNSANKMLPDPVKVETEIKVACKIPSFIEIYILGDEETRLDLNKVQYLGREDFTVKKDKYYNFQTWAFDDRHRPFYNFSSLNVRWRLIPPGAGLLDKVTYKLNTLETDQYKRVILTANEGDVVRLRAETNNYKDVFKLADTFVEKFDEVSITIKGNIELVPTKYVLYLSPENYFTIQIKGGSGDFVVSVNDSTIIDHTYSLATHTITVAPSALGYAQVVVEDKTLVSAQKVTCDIIVANPTRIELFPETNLLEESDTTTMTVAVYADEHRFDPNNIGFLNIGLSIDADRRNALAISNKKSQLNQFIVEGSMVGDYSLTATLLFQNQTNDRSEPVVQKLFSNSVQLHVFPKLQAQPARLVLAPMCIAMLKIVGGPSENIKNKYDLKLAPRGEFDPKPFKIEAQDSSSIFSVKGSGIGEEDVTFEIRYKNNSKVFTSITVPVKVARINGLEVQSMVERKIHIGAQTRLVAGMKIDNEILKFNLCPFQFAWTSKQDHILHIHTPSLSLVPCQEIAVLTQQKTSHLKDYNLAVNATALSLGTAEIELRLITDHADSVMYSPLTARVEVQVINPLSTDIPTYIGLPNLSLDGGLPSCTVLPPAHPSLLVLPPYTDYQIKPNNQESLLQYTIFSPSDARKAHLSGNGILSTLGEKGKVTVLVEDTKTRAELMMINVLITHVYSIFVENSYQVATLPPGTGASLRVYLQDSMGRLFPSPKELERLSLSVFTSNPKVVEAILTEKNSVLKLNAKSEGSALISVYLNDNPEVFDTFLVAVQTVLTPNSPVSIHEGGEIKFSVKSSIPQGFWTKWISDDTRIVEIDSKGVAKARKQGETQIHFQDTVLYSARINVFKVKKLDLLSDVELTNIPSKTQNSGVYRIPFKVSTDSEEIKKLSSPNEPVDNNLEFRCQSNSYEWVEVKSEIRDEGYKQVPYCVVSILPTYPENKAIPNQISIQVTVASKDRSVGSSLSKTYNFPFVAAFKVIKPSNKELVLNKHHSSGTISIQTGDDLETTISKSVIITGPPVKRDGLTTYTITVPSNINDTITTDLVITNPKTGQREFVNIFYSPGAHINVPSVNPLAGLKLSLIDIVVLLIVGVIIIILILSMKNLSSRNNAVAQQSVMGSGAGYGVPYRGSLINSTQSTPLRPGGSFLSQSGDGSRLGR